MEQQPVHAYPVWDPKRNYIFFEALRPEAKKKRKDTNKTWQIKSTVMIRFRCKDIDLKDCEFQVQGGSREEILEITLLHLEKHHRIVNITPETRERIQRAVKG